MKFITAQKIFSILFVAAIFAASAVNIVFQRDAFKRDLAELTVPDSGTALHAVVKTLRNSVNSNITGKYRLLDLHSYLQVLMGKDEVADFKYIRSLGGALNYGNPFPIDDRQLPDFAGRIERLGKWVEKSGGKFLFLNPPDMVVRGATRYVAGMPYQDFNRRQDNILDMLRERGVDCLDLRDTFVEDGLPLDDLMYRTDHHWTIETSFHAFARLVDKLENGRPGALDPGRFYRNPESYHFRKYPQAFLGSLARGTGMAFSGLDDFTLIWPKFRREYRLDKVDPWSGPAVDEGVTEKVLLYRAALAPREPYTMSMYNVYLAGPMAWTKITNRDNPSGPRLLFIHDSFGTPVATFLAPLFSEVHTIWPVADSYRVNVEAYVRENSFDYVVFELTPGNLTDTVLDFFKKEKSAP